MASEADNQLKVGSMFITDTSTASDELFGLRPTNFVDITFVLRSSSDEVIEVEPPNLPQEGLTSADEDEVQMDLEGSVELTEGSLRALRQLKEGDLVTYNSYEDFERYVRTR